MSDRLCATCNRLRLTTDGQTKVSTIQVPSSHNLLSYLSVMSVRRLGFVQGRVRMGSDNDLKICWPSQENMLASTHESHRRLSAPLFLP